MSLAVVQVRAAGLLAQLYVQRGAFHAAAAVHEALALRSSGDGAGEAVSLGTRLQAMQDAVLQVRKSCKAILMNGVSHSASVPAGVRSNSTGDAGG